MYGNGGRELECDPCNESQLLLERQVYISFEFHRCFSFSSTVLFLFGCKHPRRSVQKLRLLKERIYIAHVASPLAVCFCGRFSTTTTTPIFYMVARILPSSFRILADVSCVYFRLITMIINTSSVLFEKTNNFSDGIG